MTPMSGSVICVRLLLHARREPEAAHRDEREACAVRVSVRVTVVCMVGLAELMETDPFNAVQCVHFNLLRRVSGIKSRTLAIATSLSENNDVFSSNISPVFATKRYEERENETL